MARILVVDDTPQNIRLIELYLRETEFEVESAAGGLEAIDRAMRGAYDLILLDVVMPGIDGFEVCRRLKNDPLTAFVPVIFLTGRMSAESDKLAAFKLGAVDYIQKPVDREELVARLRVMLRLEGARSRLDRENVGLRAELAEDAVVHARRNLAAAARSVAVLGQPNRFLLHGRKFAHDPQAMASGRGKSNKPFRSGSGEAVKPHSINGPTTSGREKSMLRASGLPQS